MKAFNLARYALIGVATVALPAGCGGSQPPLVAPGTMPQPFVATTHADRGKSWMLPEAKSDDLLYVSDGGNNVYVFSYPLGALVGTLTGSSGADGECVDKAGNVFITNAAGYIDEYRHGDVKPFKSLGDYSAYPLGCAVDPTTGNLAVTGYPGPYSTHGNVAVFKEARGIPKSYVDASVVLYWACGYDSKGNLYIDGTKAQNTFAFAELPKGSGTFTNVALDRQFRYPGAVQWDGRYVAVGTSNAGVIYRFKIDGSAGDAVGTSVLNGTANRRSAFFWIQGGDVIVPFGGARGSKSNVGFWRYPAGGAYVKRLHGFGGQQLFGVTVSLAHP